MVTLMLVIQVQNGRYHAVLNIVPINACTSAHVQKFSAKIVRENMLGSCWIINCTILESNSSTKSEITSLSLIIPLGLV